MDLSDDSGTLPAHAAAGGPVLEQEESLSKACCHTESGGTIFLQLLEFKTHLLEAVEELHIRRDAETRFEDHISKLVLEKQELEWEKESLQQQIETVAKQHTESLSNVKKQFQAKIRNTEEEKGKYQVSAELKDKEINNLKEELKSLQLLKYNMEKKSSELEQKLVLQNRSKDSHLNQLGEVEKRFSVLSRQCTMIKQAHEKLEQNVDEAMKINKKLMTANEKQEATIVSLKKELEEVRNKLIKAKMPLVKHDTSHSPTGREQHFQQLHQKLNMEADLNKILTEENVAVRAEKQDVMKSLQHAQQLLLSQTQTVNRVELELQTQREQCQALKQEHRVMQEKSKAMEDKVAQLMESYAASKNSWDKEKATFLDCIKSEQQDLKAVKQAYDELHQEHTELSSTARVQAQHISEMEMRDSSQHTRVSTEVFYTLVEEIRGEETLNELISSSELPNFGSVQLLASTQTKTPDCLEDTGAVTELVTGATAVTTVSSPDHRAIVGSVDYLSEEKSDVGSGGMSEKEQGWNNDVKQAKNYREAGESNEEQQCSRKEIQVEDVDDAGSAVEKRGTLIAQTTDRADGRGDSQGSTENTGDPKTETKDRAEGKGTHGAEGRGKTGLHTAEFQIPAQTADTTTEKSDTQQVIDFMDTEPPLAACEQSEGSESFSQKVSEKDADSGHVNEGYEMRREAHTFFSVEHQSVDHGPNSVGQDLQHSCHDEVQVFAGSVSQLPSPIHQVFEKPMEEKASLKSAASLPTELAAPLSLSSICSSQTSTTPLAAQSDGIGIVIVQEFKTTTTQPSNLSDITDEMCGTHLPQVLPQSQLFSEQSEQLQSLLTDEDDKDSNTYKKGEALSNVGTFTQNDACTNAQEPPEKSNLKNDCADITLDTEDLEFQVETGSCQENMKNVDLMMTKSKTDLKLSVHPSHESITHDSAECFKQSPAEEMLFKHTDEFSLPSSKTYRPSFDWSSIQRKTVSSSDKSDVSILRHFVQGSPVSERRHTANTLPMFLKSKHNKVPLVITRASDLLNGSSVSGTAASSVGHQQGEQKGLGETCTETATADTESRASPSITRFPVSTSIAVSKLSWQTTLGCGRAQTSPVGPSSESDWDTSCSQEREEEQSSFRVQISKIEQFLNTERLRLPKRRKTEN